jgi:mono/diheme cytochrome c family protein
MKKQSSWRTRRGISLLSGILLLVATSLRPALGQDASTNTWTAPPRAARKQNPVASDKDALAHGKQLYIAACLPCHGPEGKGDGPAASTLERNGVRVRPGNLADPKRWEESDGELFWKISEGRTPMPSWSETLNETQRWEIVTYIRTLAPKPDTNLATNKTKQ